MSKCYMTQNQLKVISLEGYKDIYIKKINMRKWEVRISYVTNEYPRTIESYETEQEAKECLMDIYMILSG